jgi:hypothetical protein
VAQRTQHSFCISFNSIYRILGLISHANRACFTLSASGMKMAENLMDTGLATGSG